jgi:hypothetical protein
MWRSSSYTKSVAIRGAQGDERQATRACARAVLSVFANACARSAPSSSSAWSGFSAGGPVAWVVVESTCTRAAIVRRIVSALQQAADGEELSGRTVAGALRASSTVRNLSAVPYFRSTRRARRDNTGTCDSLSSVKFLRGPPRIILGGQWPRAGVPRRIPMSIPAALRRIRSCERAERRCEHGCPLARPSGSSPPMSAGALPPEFIFGSRRSSLIGCFSALCLHRVSLRGLVFGFCIVFSSGCCVY